MRLTRIIYAFRHGVWPKPMEGLDLFLPKKEELSQSSSESDEEEDYDTINISGDVLEHTLEYTEGEEYVEEEDMFEDSSEVDQEESDSEFEMDIEETGSKSWKTKTRSGTKMGVASNPPQKQRFSINQVILVCICVCV